MKKLVEITSKYVVFVPVSIVLMYLFYVSLFSNATAAINFPSNEKMLLYSDQPLFHLVMFVLTFLCLFFFKKRKIEISERMKRRIFAIWIIILLLWVLITQMIPVGDMESVLSAASQVAVGNFSAFEPAGYGHYYANQWGIIFLMSRVLMLAGQNNYLIFQFINILFLLLIAISMMHIVSLLFNSKATTQITLVLFLLFIPLPFYVTMVYGNIPGLGLSLFALWMLMEFLKKPTTKGVLLGSFAMGLAILIKQNYLIFLIAMLLILLVNFLKLRNIKTLVFIVILLVSYKTMDYGVEQYIEQYSEVQKEDTIPKTAWIAMGLQDGDRAPGWFNGYNVQSFALAEFNAKECDKIVRENISISLENFAYEKDYAIDFFSKKIATQWIDPTFQSFWRHAVDSYYTIDPAEFVHSITFGNVFDVLLVGMNFIQTFVYFGVLCYLFFCIKNIQTEELTLLVVFLGGFLFHIIWEGKATYTLSFFVCLIPYAAKGIDELLNHMLMYKRRVVEDIEHHNIEVLKKDLLVHPLTLFLGLVIILFLFVSLPFSLNEKLFRYTENNEAYKENREIMRELDL